jgi:hypothetical protein
VSGDVLSAKSPEEKETGGACVKPNAWTMHTKIIRLSFRAFFLKYKFEPYFFF